MYVFYFILFYFILFIRERAGAAAGGEGEADSLLSREAHAGLDPRTVRS